jgi:acyl-ACP thioesterase
MAIRELYSEQRRINYYDLDCGGALRLSALLRMVHIAADVNAKELGAGFSTLSALSMGFILQRFSLSVNRMPAYDDVVTLRTWPAALERGLFVRKGDMYGAEGQKLMEWASLWLLFDLAARRILRPSALPAPFECIGAQGVETEAERIEPRDDMGGEVYSYRHTVRYADADTYMHMNNSVYGDLIANAMFAGGAGASAGEWSRVHINYLSETRLGEEISVTRRREGALSYIAGTVGERAAFRAVVTARETPA